MRKPRKKRGGIYVYSELYINYTIRELVVMLKRIERQSAKYQISDKNDSPDKVK
jgi:hypothetical protein